ncbi:MAG: DNA/RNA nuclease SfsA [Clostridium sp.]
MNYNKNIFIGEFVNRPNRFNASVILNGEEIVVHVPNTGRCKEILQKGVKVLLREELGETRKTKYDLVGVYKGEELISIDSQIPNKVVEEALKNQKIDKLKIFNNILREKTYGNSRFDFKLGDNLGNEYYLEVKGVTLEENGHARFPDAPTERGRKHILELIEVKESGRGAGVLLLIQMESVKTFSPNDDTDPKFGEALREAKNKGVDVMAYNCKVDMEGITLYNEVEVIL